MPYTSEDLEYSRTTEPQDTDLPSWLTYSPEKFVDNYGHKPVRHWQAFSLARLESPDNFLAD